MARSRASSRPDACVGRTASGSGSRESGMPAVRVPPALGVRERRYLAMGPLAGFPASIPSLAFQDMPAPVYLDHAATTPVRQEVLEAMLPFFGPRFGNPSSMHRWGREARTALDEARDRLSRCLGASP